MNNLQSILQWDLGNIQSFFMFGWIIAVVAFLFVAITIIVPTCLIFQKAGREWWEALIPFYNAYIMTVIIGQPWWILIGFFIPIINWVIGAYMYYHLSKRFGFDIPFAIGLVFLPFIFLPILGFGGALYTKPE